MRLIFTLLLCLASLAQATVEVREFDSPEQEARYKHLIEILRCTVCQNQNIAESNADLAGDLRRKTYQMLQAGKSDEEILDYMVDRYGDFVLYRPPFRLSTSILWVGPFALLGIGLLVVLRVVRGKKGRARAVLTPEQQRRAEQLLTETDKGTRS
jgi:cytochrome c-type biogenesis protein CcmH